MTPKPWSKRHRSQRFYDGASQFADNAEDQCSTAVQAVAQRFDALRPASVVAGSIILELPSAHGNPPSSARNSARSMSRRLGQAEAASDSVPNSAQLLPNTI